MLKKGLSLILMLVICISVIAVLPVSVSAKEVDLTETALAAPGNIKAAATTTQGAIKITWSAVRGAARYQVFKKQIGVDTHWKKLAQTTTNSYIHKGCLNNTKYTYTVRCLNAKGAFVSGYQQGPVLHYFRYPENIKAIKKDDNGNVTVSWSAVKGAAKYAVYYKTASTNGWILYKQFAVGTSLTLAGCKKGVTYTFTVRACNSAGRCISSYYPKGTALTYKLTPDWSKVYSDFILNKKYETLKTNYTFAGDKDYFSQCPSDIRFSLYDVNRDGVPELIGDCGMKLMGANQRYMYMCENNKLIAVGRFATGKIFYQPNTKGFFSTYSHQGVSVVTYHYLDRHELKDTEVVAYNLKDIRDPSRGYNTTIEDQSLYQVYLKCTAASTDGNILRTPRYQISEYNYAQINKIGWNAFIKKYGY